MAKENTRPYPHIYLQGKGVQRGYTAHQGGGGGSDSLPQRDRAGHAEALTQALTKIVQQGETLIDRRDPALEGGTKGFYVEFTLPAAQAEIVDKLENRQGKFPIELINVHPQPDGQVAATVFVPEKQKDYYLKKIAAYRDEDNVRQRTLPDGNVVTMSKPKNEKLVASIETARLAVARSFYTDNPELFPAPSESIWWEIWLRKGTRESYDKAALALNLPMRERSLEFAEREIVIARGTAEQLGRIVANTDAVAELRLARDTPSLFMEMDGAEQRTWSEDIAGRLAKIAIDAPAVCLLDSGTTFAHPLIAPFLNIDDQQAIDATWSVEDSSKLSHGGHGTQMSGLALHGDLIDIVDGTGTLAVSHRLESVKILPDRGANDPDLYGAITAQSVARAEIAAPDRRRAICLAITSEGDHWRGRPSSWSAKLDALTFGRDEIARLFVVSAGNIRNPIAAANYPASNDTYPIENPAQAWNVLTVGAYTEKTLIADPTYAGWIALGAVGDIMPRSRTSVSWIRDWPLKPDVVFEGGNIGVNPATGLGDDVDDLSLLTTYRNPNERAFTTFGDTSAATALGARMSAQILAERPEMWPETVRALIVHSAEWTDAMKAHQPTMGKHILLRRYGFGVPSLVRSLGSLDHDITIVNEDTIVPFKLNGTKAETNKLALHSLPWPKAKLLEHGEALVQLRITLSYFIEPNPGERGLSRRHVYASHGLRFELKHADEALDVFVRRRTSEVGTRPPARAGGDTGWSIGPQLRNRGSLHADIWEGTAAELADRDAIIVYPVGGWWRENIAQGHAGEAVRYSLVTSLRAAEGTKLYSEIAAEVVPEITIEI